MAEAFEPITTQEAFEAAVADRLAPYADYNDLKAQNEALAGQVAELNTRCQTYETDALKTRVAHEVGLPFDLAGRLTGSKEEDIRKDAHAQVILNQLYQDPARTPARRPRPQRQRQKGRLAQFRKPADEQRVKENTSWQIF